MDGAELLAEKGGDVRFPGARDAAHEEEKGRRDCQVALCKL